jgi:hypothetical protein
MFIGSSERVKIEELFYWGMVFCLGACACLVIGFVFMVSFSKSRIPERGSLAAPATQAKNARSYDYIGKGALSLNSSRSCQFIPWIGNEILLLARNTRPDAHEGDANLLISIKGTGGEKKVKLGETIYLSEQDKEKEGKRGLRFSENSTPLSIKPTSLNRSQVNFEVLRSLDQKVEKGQLTLSPAAAGKYENQKNDAPFMRALKEAKHWSQDRLLELYGGKEYRFLKEKEKIHFVQEGSESVCFVSAGDFLIWEEGKWRNASPTEISSSVPVAQVKVASPRVVEIEAWDETGFLHLHQKLEAQSHFKAMNKESALFSSIRLRNGSEVTCIAGKRRMVLREGDWLLKTASGWRNLKRAEQIEDCIYHRLMGELFIFEGFEVVQGKTHMKGHLFDPMRSQMSALSFPVSADKKTTKTKEGRRRR